MLHAVRTHPVLVGVFVPMRSDSGFQFQGLIFIDL